jgi:tRNA-binding protein
MEINYSDFTKVDIRVGTITRAETFPEARNPAFKIWLDFGAEIGERKSSAQITHYYDPDNLIGKQVAAVINFPAKQIGPFMSECLVLGFPDESGEVVLISPSHIVPNGGKLF